MSEESKDGGPAFPGAVYREDSCGVARVCWCNEGMTMRDWFAGRALVAIAACEERGSLPHDMAVWAGSAYALADAMLTERAKPGEQRDKPVEGESSK